VFRDGRSPILVATDVAARGLGKHPFHHIKFFFIGLFMFYTDEVFFFLNVSEAPGIT